MSIGVYVYIFLFYRALKANLGQRDPKELMALMVKLDPRDLLDFLEDQDTRDGRVFRDLQGCLERMERRCVCYTLFLNFPAKCSNLEIHSSI